MSPVGVFRKGLAFPLFVLQLVAAVLIYGLGRGSYFLATHVARGTRTMARGANRHILWPIMSAYRLVAGEPRWRVKDLLLGIQPRTDAERALAEADARVGKLGCVCDRPGCSRRGEPPLYVLLPTFFDRPPS